MEDNQGNVLVDWCNCFFLPKLHKKQLQNLHLHICTYNKESVVVYNLYK